MSNSLLKGPRWVELRLHRTALRTAGIALVLGLALALFLRWGASAYPPVHSECYGPCEATFLGFADGHVLLYETMKNASMALLLLPVLVGAYVAGPLIGRELESGTHKLAWTQSFVPARWLASRLTTAAALATVAALAVTGIFLIGTAGIRGMSNLNWADRGVYEATGPALVAYCLLAVALGTILGLLIRRTLLAAAASGLVTGVVLFGLGSLRWQLMPVVTASGPYQAKDPYPWNRVMPEDYFGTALGVHNAAGERFIAQDCTPAAKKFNTYCPDDTRITGWYLDYHPRSHFWYVQLIETGIVLALAAAATYAAFRVLRRRTA